MGTMGSKISHSYIFPTGLKATFNNYHYYGGWPSSKAHQAPVWKNNKTFNLAINHVV